MSEHLADIKLGQPQVYVENYDPGLLLAVPRAASRQLINVNAELHVNGLDLWTAYELSWLSSNGKPQVAIGEFVVPASSPNLIESKSFKYYLNSFNQTEVSSLAELQRTLTQDLSRVAGAPVEARLWKLEDYSQYRVESQYRAEQPLAVTLLDDLPLSAPHYHPASALLRMAEHEFSGVWCSHLLKSNCPVTGQPDWASLWIGWQGRSLVPESLLSYIVSFRKHQDFHEACVERIFSDLLAVGQPEDLWVYARYTRRGGLDINPFRSMRPMDAPKIWGARQ